MNIRPEEQQIVDDFYANNPELGALHKTFLEYAADELSAMSRPRFGQHDLVPVFTYDDFVTSFGIDTSHQLHPIKQHSVLERLMDVDYPWFDPSGRADLKLTAVVHDMGEPFCAEGDSIVGTRLDEYAETVARHQVLRVIAPEHAEEIIERTEPTLSDKESMHFSIFQLSERIGYVLTGRRIAIEYLAPRPFSLPAEEQRAVAGLIATDVYYRTLEKLEKQRDTSKFLTLMLFDASGVIKAAEEQFAADYPKVHKARKDQLKAK